MYIHRSSGQTKIKVYNLNLGSGERICSSFVSLPDVTGWPGNNAHTKRLSQDVNFTCVRRIQKNLDKLTLSHSLSLSVLGPTHNLEACHLLPSGLTTYTQAHMCSTSIPMIYNVSISLTLPHYLSLSLVLPLSLSLSLSLSCSLSLALGFEIRLTFARNAYLLKWAMRLFLKLESHSRR